MVYYLFSLSIVHIPIYKTLLSLKDLFTKDQVSFSR